MTKAGTPTRRDIIDDLLLIKSRRGRDDVMVGTYTHELEDIVKRAKDDYDVILKFVPVRAVNFIEVFTRETIANFINQCSQYLERAEVLFTNLNCKPEFKAIAALHGQDVTVDDVMAHMARLNKLADINSVMTVLLGNDYFSALSNVYDRFDVEVRGRTPTSILGEKSHWYPIMTRMFEVRHIIVHEVSDHKLLPLAQAREYAKTTARFLKASWPGFPRWIGVRPSPCANFGG